MGTEDQAAKVTAAFDSIRDTLRGLGWSEHIVAPDWKPISELPEPGKRPGRQFICLEGSRFHSGVRWRRRQITIAYTDNYGPQGYRSEDIRRAMHEGDMDDGEVTHWASFACLWPAP